MGAQGAVVQALPMQTPEPTSPPSEPGLSLCTCRCEYTYYLLLCVLIGAEQVHGLHVAEINVVAQQEDEEQLAHVLLLAVAVQGLVSWSTGGGPEEPASHRQVLRATPSLMPGVQGLPPPLNLERMLASSLLILLISASLLLPGKKRNWSRWAGLRRGPARVWPIPDSRASREPTPLHGG